jgi:protein-L-isoaspartate(D-aspartate) O-methyltransferase
MKALGFDNVHVLDGNGTLGAPDHAPFDAIAVAACGPHLPPALVRQLGPAGRIVMPVQLPDGSQVLMRYTRDPTGVLREERLLDVHFVPLIGADGFRDPNSESNGSDPSKSLG